MGRIWYTLREDYLKLEQSTLKAIWHKKIWLVACHQLGPTISWRYRTSITSLLWAGPLLYQYKLNPAPKFDN